MRNTNAFSAPSLAQLAAKRLAALKADQKLAFDVGGLTLERLVCGAEFGNLRASPVQIALLRAADGRPLNGVISADECMRHFGCPMDLIGRERPRIVVVRSGVRCGKSYIAALACILNALTCSLDGLSMTDMLRVPIVAPKLSLTRQTFQHAIKTIENTGLRTFLVEAPLVESFKLRRPDGRVVLFELVAASVGGANLRSTWLTGIVFDEADFHGDEGKVVNLDENLASVKPRVRPGGQIWVPSSPWLEGSEFDQLFTASFGQPGSTLAFFSSSREMNPSLSVADEEAMRAEDPARASREYDGLPSPLGSNAFLPPEAIEAAINRERPATLAPGPYITTSAGCDLGFRKNSSTLAIAAILDGKVRVVFHEEKIPERGKPLVPGEVVSSFAKTCAAYNCRSMRGDRYSLDATCEELSDLGKVRFADGAMRQVEYDIFDPTRPAQTRIFTTLRRLLLEGKVELPNDPRLLAQLRSIESRMVPGGQVVVEVPHQGASHGDLAMSVALACSALEQFVMESDAKIEGYIGSREFETTALGSDSLDRTRFSGTTAPKASATDDDAWPGFIG